MDERLRGIISKKIGDVLGSAAEVAAIAESLPTAADRESLALGIAVGRLYNSFYYQCRRILGRDPTAEEFAEFVEIIRERGPELLDRLR